jgi:two-component system nitrogen regulation response regulator GlnG
VTNKDDEAPDAAGTEPVGHELAEIRVERVCLTVASGPDCGKVGYLEAGTLLIGSSDGCGLRLQEPSVSRRHAQVEIGDDGVVLKDLSSRNGTFLNGRRVREAYLSPGDQLRLGRVEIRFEPRVEAVKVPASPHSRFGGLFGQSTAMRALFGVMERVAPTACTILIEGESGTGKELAARALHENSPRATSRFTTVDCSAIQPDLIDSELFGHVAGAFTGAQGARRGLAEHAHGGTLFIDEVGELPLSIQPKLLRLLEAREVRPVGANDPKNVNVRVIAATHRDLPAMVREDRFRQDLFFRLAVLRIRLPPLRDRLEDLPGLVETVLRADSGDPVTLHPDALSRLAAHPWPGNVRELRNVLTRARALHGGPVIRAEHLIFDDAANQRVMAIPASAVALDSLENDAIRRALKQSGGNLTRAAAALGIHRNTLRQKLKKAGPQER